MASPESGGKSESLPECMTDEQIKIFAEVMADPQAAIDALPEEEREKYEAAQRSIVEARQAGERIAHTLWLD